MNKPRGDSKLKTLPAAQQARIIDWLNSGTRQAALENIQTEFGFSTSGASLSEFYSWWHLGRQLEQAADFADELRATLRDLPELRLEDEQLNAAAQAVFEMQAAKTGDDKLFLGLRLARQRDRKLALDHEKQRVLERRTELLDEQVKLARDKWQFDAAKAVLARLEELRSIQGDNHLSDSDKLNAVRERLFGSAPG